MRNVFSVVRQLPAMLAVMMAQLIGPPPFKFNRKLFRELISKLKEGGEVRAPDAEPKVEFVNGPIDGILGRFNREEMKIEVDQLEILTKSIAELQDVTDVQRLKDKFDTEITKALAHEGKHWQIEKRHGFAAFLERIMVNGVLGIVGSVVLWWVYIIWFKLISGVTIPSAYVVSPALGIALAITLLVMFIIFLLTAGLRYVIMWNVIAAAIAYKISFSERAARSAEAEAVKNHDWDGVIKVE